MKPAEILACVVLHGAVALSWGHVSRALLLSGRYFRDGELAVIARALLLHSGDWRAAVDWLRKGPRRLSPARLASFERWAESLAPKRQPLLLPWKGGAA